MRRVGIARHAPAGRKQLPVLSGEWGYAAHSKGVSPEAQADYLVRQQLVNLLSGVPLSVWYDWKDDGTDPANPEHHFGTVGPDLKPKPAYVAVRTLTHELNGCRVVRRLEVGQEKDYVLPLEDGDRRQKLAAWTLGEPHTLTVKGLVPAGEAGGKTISGEPYTPKVGKEGLALDLTASPKSVTIKGGTR